MKTTAEAGTMLNHNLRVMLRYEDDLQKTCEACERFEKGGYCLYYSRRVKDSDLVTCSDFSPADDKDQS